MEFRGSTITTFQPCSQIDYRALPYSICRWASLIGSGLTGIAEEHAIRADRCASDLRYEELSVMEYSINSLLE